MTEEKKDLTGLLQFSKSLEESGQAPAVPEGAVMEDKPIEKIDAFESLEDYALTNPVSEPSSDSSQEGHSEPTAPPIHQTSSGTDSSDFPVNSSSENPSDFASDTSALASDPSAPPISDFTPDAPLDFSSPAESEFPPSSIESSPSTDFSPQNLHVPSEEKPVTPPAPKASPQTPLEKVKKFVEKLPLGKPAVPASFPFSLLIQGFLRPEERDRLLDILSRENMGIREMDLEPQLASGKILIPRISEYAGVLLVQALRGAKAQIKLGPSDTIFATADTRSESEEGLSEVSGESSSSYSSEISHPAEQIPLTTDEKLSHLIHFSIIDTLMASATLKATVIEAESSAEYLDIVEALQREIKYKAYRKGAHGVINFKIQLNQLSSPTHYRILAMGTAIKPENSI